MKAKMYCVDVSRVPVERLNNFCIEHNLKIIIKNGRVMMPLIEVEIDD